MKAALALLLLILAACSADPVPAAEVEAVTAEPATTTTALDDETALRQWFETTYPSGDWTGYTQAIRGICDLDHGAFVMAVDRLIHEGDLEGFESGVRVLCPAQLPAVETVRSALTARYDEAAHRAAFNLAYPDVDDATFAEHVSAVRELCDKGTEAFMTSAMLMAAPKTRDATLPMLEIGVRHLCPERLPAVQEADRIAQL